MALRNGNSQRRGTRTHYERSCGKRGFSKCLNPSAWVRAVHKFNSVIVTMRFQSMHIPVSIRTSNAMANIKGLVDSGATNCFISPTFITSARTQVTARLFTGAQQESSASCTSSQVKCRVIIYYYYSSHQ